LKLLISGDRKRRRSVLLIWDVREGDSLNTIAPCKEILKYNWFLVYLFQNAKKNRNLFLFFFLFFGFYCQNAILSWGSNLLPKHRYLPPIVGHLNYYPFPLGHDISLHKLTPFVSNPGISHFTFSSQSSILGMFSKPHINIRIYILYWLYQHKTLSLLSFGLIKIFS